MMEIFFADINWIIFKIITYTLYTYMRWIWYKHKMTWNNVWQEDSMSYNLFKISMNIHIWKLGASLIEQKPFQYFKTCLVQARAWRGEAINKNIKGEVLLSLGHGEKKRMPKNDHLNASLGTKVCFLILES